jgi:hypothetical protein
VKWDGFDVLEKEAAGDYFAGKTWADVLHGFDCGRYFLEEWAVLSPPALRYFARAYLEHFLDEFYSDNPECGFLQFFALELYQVIYIHKGSPFNPEQTVVLKRVALVASQEARSRFEFFGEDIARNAEQFLAELRLHLET